MHVPWFEWASVNGSSGQSATFLAKKLFDQAGLTVMDVASDDDMSDSGMNSLKTRGITDTNMSRDGSRIVINQGEDDTLMPTSSNRREMMPVFGSTRAQQRPNIQRTGYGMMEETNDPWRPLDRRPYRPKLLERARRVATRRRRLARRRRPHPTTPTPTPTPTRRRHRTPHNHPPHRHHRLAAPPSVAAARPSRVAAFPGEPTPTTTPRLDPTASRSTHGPRTRTAHRAPLLIQLHPSRADDRLARAARPRRRAHFFIKPPKPVFMYFLNDQNPHFQA